VETHDGREEGPELVLVPHGDDPDASQVLFLVLPSALVSGE
jgi:hypothetical protein